MGLAGTSLAAAIPGGVLFYVLLMAVLNSLDPMPMMLKVATLMMLVVALVMALFPAYILIWFRRDKVVLASQKAGAGGGAAALVDGQDADIFAEDLVDQDVGSDQSLEPEDEWADSGEMGDATENLTAEFHVPSEDELALETVDIDEDTFPTAEFEVDEDLASALDAGDEFGQTTQNFGSIEADEEAVTAADFGEVDEDTLQTMEFEAEEVSEEVDEFGQTQQEFATLDAEEEFTPAIDFDDDFTFEDFGDDEDEGKKK